MNTKSKICEQCHTKSIKSDSIGREFCRECARRKRFVPNRIDRLSELASIIHLRHGKQTLVDTNLVPILQKIRWWWWRGRNNKEYVAGKLPITHKQIRLHRFVMDAKSGQEIDHRNGNGYDNRRSNLRFATHVQNQQNRRHQINSTSDFKGTTRRADTGKWRARIIVSGHRLALGNFDTAIEAGEAYAEAARKHFGEFARTV